jgi:hypothetical protein
MTQVLGAWNPCEEESKLDEKLNVESKDEVECEEYLDYF